VAISNGYIVVGADRDDEGMVGQPKFYGAGSAYVFKLTGSTWAFQQKLVAPDRTQDDSFGWGVAIDGNHIVIGSSDNDTDANGQFPEINTGAAYVFQLDGLGVWNFQQKLVAPDRVTMDIFAFSVDISGANILIGAYRADENEGAAYLYQLVSNSWVLQQKLGAGETGQSSFGYSVAIEGSRAAVGTRNAVYTFQLTGGSWVHHQKLVSFGTASGEFGASLSLSGNFILVGAKTEATNASNLLPIDDAGAAYVFKLVNGNWTAQQKIVASDRDYGDGFGDCVAVSGGNFVVGAYREGVVNNVYTSNKGAAYLFNFANFLPVALTSFNAKIDGSSVKVQWETASEKENKEFILSRSKDGERYKVISTIAGKGNSLVANQYAYLDKYPLTGLNYYKLEQVDNDGKITEEGVKTVNFNLASADVTLFPMPAYHKLEVKIQRGEYGTLYLTNIQGVKVYKSAINKDLNYLQIDLSKYAKGIYVLTLQGENANISKKVVKL
ncbi:MAG: T9SS type A sorting domain-containing protein, partial [Chitinophagaceae bacterium]